MRKIFAVMLSVVLCVGLFACGNDEIDIPSYEGHDGIPDFGQFLTDAEFDQQESESWSNTIGGAGAPYIYIYYVPKEKESDISGYVDLLEKQGFITESDGKIEYGEEVLYENIDIEAKVKFVYGEDKNAPEDTYMVQVWIL